MFLSKLLVLQLFYKEYCCNKTEKLTIIMVFPWQHKSRIDIEEEPDRFYVK